jgi:arginyl-tRNA synthetase
MHTTFDPIRTFIAEQVLKELEDWQERAAGHGLTVQSIHDALVTPPQAAMGDLAFPCFPLAKALKTAPPRIAAELAKGLALRTEKRVAVSAAGPYVNFVVSPEIFGRDLLEPVLSGEFFNRKLTTGNPRTMVEYSQPNTHKEIHVGHMRNASLGDALVRLLRYAGTDVVSATFPGDVGTHVAKCLWYLKHHCQDPIPSEGKGEWLGLIYTRANQKLEDEVGSANEEKNRRELTEILVQLEAGKGEYFDLWNETRQWSVELMHRVYDWAGIQFDQWYWESDVDSASVRYVKDLHAQGKLVLSEGAVGMDLNHENLGFCLLLKKDGTGLYATKDLELARRKFQDHRIEKSIYVVDVRQALHFQQVFRVLETIGFAQAKNCLHLAYNFVELPDGAMSSRKGNIVPLTRLVDSMEAHVKAAYLSRYESEWSQEEINRVAHWVAVGAIKYGMLRIDNNKKIVFDMKEWLKLDGDSGPFIQYSAARIFSLVRKLGPVAKTADWSALQHPAEHRLMNQLLEFHPVVVEAAESTRPSALCTYLFTTAQAFNGFYHECPIGQAETAELKDARLALAAATGEILKKGLELLGIPAPERM